MSCKLQRLLFNSVKRLGSEHVLKSTTYIKKQNFCCSNVPWNRSRIFCPATSLQYHGVLYESRAELHITKPDACEGSQAANKKEQLIYFGAITARIKGLKVVSYSTSLLGIIVQPIIYKQVMGLATPAMVALFTVMGFFTIVTPFLIHGVTKKYITEIKYDPNEDVYISKTMTFFLQDKIERFKLENVKFNDSAGLFNTFTIKGKPFMLFREGFLDREHFIKLLGFDKPIDLKLGNCEDSTVKNATQK